MNVWRKGINTIKPLRTKPDLWDKASCLKRECVFARYGYQDRHYFTFLSGLSSILSRMIWISTRKCESGVELGSSVKKCLQNVIVVKSVSYGLQKNDWLFKLFSTWDQLFCRGCSKNYKYLCRVWDKDPTPHKDSIQKDHLDSYDSQRQRDFQLLQNLSCALDLAQSSFWPLRQAFYFAVATWRKKGQIRASL